MATTVVIPAATLAAYPAGKAVCQTVGGRPVIVYKSADGAVKVAPNSCAHMGNMGRGNDVLAKFAESKDIEDAGKLVCGFHQDARPGHDDLLARPEVSCHHGQQGRVGNEAP